MSGQAAAAAAVAPDRRQRTVRGGVLSLGTSVAMQGLSVVSGVLLARILGPAGRGDLAAVLLWPAVFAAAGGLSAGEGVTYVTARAAAPVPVTTATALAIGGAQSLVLVPVGWLLVPVLLAHYGADTMFAGRLFLAWIPTYLAGQMAMAVLRGAQRWTALNLWRFCGVAVTVAGLVALAVVHRFTVLAATWVYIVASLAALALALGVLARYRWLGLRPRPALARSIVTFGLKAHLGDLASQANLNLDKVAVALFLAPSALGRYTVAVTLSAPLMLLGSSLGMVAMPVVAAATSPLERRRQLCWFVRSLLCFSTATTVLLVLLAPALIRVFFGAAFLPVVLVAQVSITAGMSRAVIQVVGYGLYAFDRPLVPSIAEVVALGVTVVGLAVLLPLIGLMGAALTSLLAYSTSAGYMIAFAKRRLGFRLVDLLVPRVADLGVWARSLR